MLRNLAGLEFVKSRAGGFAIQMRPPGKMVETSLDLQLLQFDRSIQHGKDMLVLPDDTSHGRVTHRGILFERFLEDFQRPLSLMSRQNVCTDLTKILLLSVRNICVLNEDGST